jgi:protein-S-isoprenylcysteine O-methyltransferase Ste14
VSDPRRDVNGGACPGREIRQIARLRARLADLSRRSREAAKAEALAQKRAGFVETLARRRVPLGFGFGVLAFWLATPTPASLLAGTPVAAAGELMRIWAAGHLNKSREVTVSGPYRWFAHPLYIGSSVIGVGLSIAGGSLAVAAIVAIYLGVTMTAAVRNEEAFLRRTFGDRYDRYRRGPDDAASDRRRRFSLAQAMKNREYRAVVGLVLAVLLLAWKATYNGVFWRSGEPRIMRPGG